MEMRKATSQQQTDWEMLMQGTEWETSRCGKRKALPRTLKEMATYLREQADAVDALHAEITGEVNDGQ
jgi:hypothetical protein